MPACMPVCRMHAWCLRSPVEDVGSLGVTLVAINHTCAEEQIQVRWNNCGATSSAPGSLLKIPMFSFTTVNSHLPSVNLTPVILHI